VQTWALPIYRFSPTARRGYDRRRCGSPRCARRDRVGSPGWPVGPIPPATARDGCRERRCVLRRMGSPLGLRTLDQATDHFLDRPRTAHVRRFRIGLEVGDDRLCPRLPQRAVFPQVVDLGLVGDTDLPLHYRNPVGAVGWADTRRGFLVSCDPPTNHGIGDILGGELNAQVSRHFLLQTGFQLALDEWL